MRHEIKMATKLLQKILVKGAVLKTESKKQNLKSWDLPCEKMEAQILIPKNLVTNLSDSIFELLW